MLNKGAQDFHRVIHVSVRDASATAITRIRELGGTIETRNSHNKDCKNNKFMRLSKEQRQDAEIVEQAATRVGETWNRGLRVGAEVTVEREEDVA